MTVATAIPGLSELTSALDLAVQQPGVERITQGIKETLITELGQGRIELPAAVRRPRQDGYARRLLHRSREHGYTVIAMIWGPGQGTALHDHAGMWCVEGVLEGEIDVVQYDLLGEEQGLYRFRAGKVVRAGVGTAGSLIPPFEYHTIANPSAEAAAITLHVYAGEMDGCTVFLPTPAGAYRREVKTVSYS